MPSATRLSPAEVEARLALVERNLKRGTTVARACRIARISAPTYYRWRAATGAPANPATRERVREAAREVFLRDGFSASLGKVAARAGVARQTIYNLFGTRDRLFGEVVQALYQQIVSPALVLAPDASLLEVLEQAGRHQIMLSLNPEALSLLRITLGEYQDHPELAAAAYAMRSSPQNVNVASAVAARLEREIAAGAIEPLDTHLAAETFIGSFTAHIRHRALIGEAQPTPGELEARLQLAIRLFVRGLGWAPAPTG